MIAFGNLLLRGKSDASSGTVKIEEARQMEQEFFIGKRDANRLSNHIVTCQDSNW